MISVLIPAYNAAKTLPAQLSALAQQGYRGQWEIIVADNGSRDSTAAVVQAFEDRLPIRLVDASERRGPAAARNLAAAAAVGDILAFTDADDVVLPGWLEAIEDLREFGTGPVGRFRDDDTSATRHMSATTPGFTHLGWLDCAYGTNFLIRTDLFWSFGGFDESRRTGEDVDLSWRLQLGGTVMERMPNARVAARTRNSWHSIFKQYVGYGVGDVQLVKDYRPRGLPRQSWIATARSWAGLLLRLPLLWRSSQRERWLQQAGRRVGRLLGSARYRTLVI